MKPVLKLRRSADRGSAEIGWLKSKHTFSFAEYYDPANMGFGPLRVINEDRILGGTGFGTHGHQDMEIISYVIEGALQHKDSMGNETIIYPGEVQRLTAGTGIRHSEYNHLKDKSTHFLQIWILPEKVGLKPSYGQKSFAQDFARDDLVLVASRAGRDGSISLNQDVDMYAAKSSEAGRKVLQTRAVRTLWVQVVRGEVSALGTRLLAGDGLGVQGASELALEWSKHAEFLVFYMT